MSVPDFPNDNTMFAEPSWDPTNPEVLPGGTINYYVTWAYTSDVNLSNIGKAGQVMPLCDLSTQYGCQCATDWNVARFHSVPKNQSKDYAKALFITSDNGKTWACVEVLEKNNLLESDVNITVNFNLFSSTFSSADLQIPTSFQYSTVCRQRRNPVPVAPVNEVYKKYKIYWFVFLMVSILLMIGLFLAFLHFYRKSKKQEHKLKLEETALPALKGLQKTKYKKDIKTQILEGGNGIWILCLTGFILLLLFWIAVLLKTFTNIFPFSWHFLDWMNLKNYFREFDTGVKTFVIPDVTAPGCSVCLGGKCGDKVPSCLTTSPSSCTPDEYKCIYNNLAGCKCYPKLSTIKQCTPDCLQNKCGTWEAANKDTIEECIGNKDCTQAALQCVLNNLGECKCPQNVEH